MCIRDRFLIPSLLILPRICGILGVQLAQPVADVFTFVLATFIVLRVLEELKAMREKENSNRKIKKI